MTGELPQELANVHAVFSWTYRLDDANRDAAFARLTIEEIRKVKFTANLLESWATVELMKRIAGPTVPLGVPDAAGVG